jgi:3-methyl-2-oxobutanoate hydroxymethyltransferase
MGHLGLTPQSVNRFGGFKAQGKSEAAAALIAEQAAALDAAGAFALVLELIPARLAAQITAAVRASTIGIGAGKFCDGQINVVNDLLGLSTGYIPRHAKRYAALYDQGLSAIRAYVADVRSAMFPGPEHAIGAAQESPDPSSVPEANAG